MRVLEHDLSCELWPKRKKSDATRCDRSSSRHMRPMCVEESGRSFSWNTKSETFLALSSASRSPLAHLSLASREYLARVQRVANHVQLLNICFWYCVLGTFWNWFLSHISPASVGCTSAWMRFSSMSSSVIRYRSSRTVHKHLLRLL